MLALSGFAFPVESSHRALLALNKLLAPQGEGNPFEASAANELWAWMTNEIGALPAACRRVAELRYLDAVPQPEIAERLQLNQERVKTLNRRARDLLKVRLRPWQPEGLPGAAG